MIERDEKGRVVAGSTLHQKYTKEEAISLFERLVTECIEGEYLSIQEAQMKSGIRRRTFYDIAKKYPELDELKQEMNDAIIANVNRLGLMGKFNPAIAIWRMKQLGERDSKDLSVEVKEQPLFNLGKKKK